MSSTWNGTVDGARNIMASANEGADRAVGTAKHAANDVKDSAEHAVASARTTWWDGVKAVTGLVSMVASFKPQDALGWVGLARRRSPLLALGIFGAGLAVGVGAGMLLAPRSGARSRRMLMSLLSGMEDEAKSTLGRVASEVKSEAKVVADKVDEAAGTVRNAVAGATLPNDLEATKPSAVNHGTNHHPV